MTFRDYLETANKKGKADVSVFKVYTLFVLRQRSISIHMNMLKQNGMFFNGLAWAPKSYDFSNEIRQIMNEKNLTGLNVVKCPDNIDGLTKPTYFKTNEFTAIF